MQSNTINDENDEDEKLLNELNVTFGNNNNQRSDDPNHTLQQPLDDDDDDDNGTDIFLLASQRQEQLAEERRTQRRKRLREISTNHVAEADVVTSSSSSTSATMEKNATTIDTSNKDLQPHHHHHHNSQLTTDINTATATTTTTIQMDDIVSLQQQNFQNQNIHPPVEPLGTSKRSFEEKHTNDDSHNNNNNNNNDVDDDDDFDMFSSSVSPPNHHTDVKMYHNEIEQNNQPQRSSKNQQQQQEWDDLEGYYKAVIGETIDLIIHPSTNVTSTTTTTTTTTTATVDTSSLLIRVRVAGLIGKGVFSTVLKCTVISNNTSIVLPNIIAMKCIRHNDSMTKTAITTELSILQKLRNSPGIVSLLLPTSLSSSSSSSSSSTNNNSNSITPLEYRGHILFVFPCMEYNLRDVLQKFGKGIGISLPAVRSYFGQLLAALSHLHKFHIIHADIKPDNVLVSSDFAVIQIADFGSAMDMLSPDPSTNVTTLPTPYLVSRFYRAPEIILGLVPITHMIDLWSVAVTVAELFIGDVLFRGSSNNDMLYVFQQHLGPFTNRMIRQHLIQCQKFGTSGGTQLSPHFQLLPGTGNSYHFTQRTTDTVTGVPVLKVLSLVVTDTTTNSNSNNGSNVVKFPLGTPLSTKLLKAKTAKDTRKMVHQFIDLLTKCLLLDPSRRITLKDALRHEFFIVNTATTTTTNNTMNATAGAVIK